MTDTANTPGLSRAQLKTLSLAALGGALEFYDFVIFVFFAGIMGQLFFPPDMPDWLRLVQTFGIFAAGYLARPLGGIVMAHYGDLLGRKQMFMFSILLMAVPTLLIGLLPTYAQIGVLAPVLLLLFRVMQGAALGGEAPGAWVFVTEHVSVRHRCLACGTLTGGLLTGILIGALVAQAVNLALSESEQLAWGWRLPFLVGGVFGLLGMLVRRQLHESPVFADMRERSTLASEMPLKLVLRSHAPAVVLTMLMTWVMSACVVVTLLLMPTLLQKLGMPRGDALNANSMAILSALAGIIVAGVLADRFGAGRLLAACCAWMGIAFWWFYSTAVQDVSQATLPYVVAAFGLGLTALVPAIAVSAFPPPVRFSGLSFGYNTAYAIFGGLTPVALSLALKDYPLAPAWYIAGVCVLGVFLGVYLALRKPGLLAS